MMKFGFCEKKSKSKSKSLSSNSPTKKNSPPKKNSPKQTKKKSPPPKKKKIIKKKPRNDEDENLNNIPLVVPKGMESYMRPEEDVLKIRTWESPNRKIFASWFNTHYKKYRTRKATADVECDGAECEAKPTTFDLFTHQKIVRDYLNTHSPYRGLLIFHG